MGAAARWTGRETRLLRHALHLAVRDFAEDLGVSPRTISKWERAGVGHCPRPETQRALDTMLGRSSEAVRARFRESVGAAPRDGGDLPEGQPSCACGARLAVDNRDLRCARCTAAGRSLTSSGPPAQPPQFWDDPELCQALRSRHMGQILRSYRLHYQHRSPLSQETVAAWASITQAQVSRMENGPPVVHLDRLTYWAQLLSIPAEHLWFTLPNEPPGPPSLSEAARLFGPTDNAPPPLGLRATAPPPLGLRATALPPWRDIPADAAATEEDDQLRRRDLLNVLGGTAALALGSDFGEGTRRGLERFLAAEVHDRDLDEWERSVDVYGVEIGSAPPTLMLQHLLADIHEVNDLLGSRVPPPSHRRLLRVAAQLSVLTAVTIIATGAPQAGRRWWRTARRTAGQLGDAQLDSFVLAQQAVLAMYCGYSQEQVLDLADEALSASGRDLVCSGAASATAARAQALSILGRDDEARQALDRLRRLVDRLPGDVTDASATWFAYPEWKLRHVESYVSTRLGRTHDAVSAQDAAIRLLPQGKYRGLSQVQLHRAACMIMDGYVDEGIQHATSTLQALPANLRSDGLIHNVAHAAVNAVPASARSATPVMDFRELLAVTARSS